MLKEFFKYILYFEKPRFYSGATTRYVIRITQKFWDEMKERKKWYEEQNKVGGFPFVDTTYGSETADLGKRPVVPDWIVNFRSTVFSMQGLLGWCLIVGYILSRLFKC